jgi:hypothetical protein
LLSRLRPLWRNGAASHLAERFAVVARFAADMRALGPANFLYADGDALFAHGDRRVQRDGRIAPPGLWRLHRACRADPDALAPSGITISTSAASQTLTLLASVPLSEEPWVPLAAGEAIAITDGSPRLAMTPGRELMPAASAGGR